MINAETFPANLRGSLTIPSGSQHFDAEDFPELPPLVVLILNRGWAIAPVLAHSLSASVKKSMVGLPTSDPASLLSIAREHPDCNWAAETGNGILVFEVNSEAGLPALRHLCQNEWDWRETLHFRRGALQFFAFHHSGRRVRFLGNRFPGLKSHWNGSVVLLPPSWFVFGPPVAYASDSNAAILDAPAWLLD